MNSLFLRSWQFWILALKVIRNTNIVGDFLLLSFGFVLRIISPFILKMPRWLSHIYRRIRWICIRDMWFKVRMPLRHLSIWFIHHVLCDTVILLWDVLFIAKIVLWISEIWSVVVISLCWLWVSVVMLVILRYSTNSFAFVRNTMLLFFVLVQILIRVKDFATSVAHESRSTHSALCDCGW